MLTDFLNIPTSWSEKRNSVVLGVTMENVEIRRILRAGLHLYLVKDDDPGGSDFQLSGRRDSGPHKGQGYPGGKMPANPAKPTLGQKVGPFTEVAPSSVDTSGPRRPWGQHREGCR